MLKFIKSTKFSVILLAVAVLLIFLHYVGILKPIENLVIQVLSPIQYRVYSVSTGINNFYSSFTGSKDLVEENKKLSEEINQLTIQNAQLKTQLQEQGELLIQNNFLAENSLEAIAAKVIGKNPEPNLQSIILNKGSKDGLIVGLSLITEDGLMVGKVSKVKRNSAEAILINDSRSHIAAMVQNEANSKGVIIGEHGLSLKLELIPQNEIIHEGDVVVTSGLEPTIPRGLVIGKITRITSESNNFFQTAWVQPLVRIENLTVVSILRQPDY